MEDYRKISWSAILGDPNVPAEQRRGLSNPDVRESLWNIFFYRDYTKYGETFGGSYTAGEWPLRHDLRLYIRKDVLANLWDYGIGAVGVEGLTDPYEQGEYLLTPSMVINEIGLPGIAEGELNAPRNLAIAPDGRIFVADSSNHRIQVFNPDGTYVTSWGSFGMEPGQFNEPWGMAVDDTHVYVADTWNHRVQKFTTDGEYVASFGISGTINDNLENSLGLFFGPRDITLLPDNQLLVTDTGNHRLQLLDRNGNFITQVGSFGNQLGQFNEPVGLGEAPDGSFFVADTWNGRIQHFSPSLFAVDEWRVEAWGGQSINNKPYVAVDSFGRVYATDPEGFRILIFSPTGEYLGRFGQFSTGIDGFGLPNGIAIDAQDNIYIADATNHRVLKFDAIFGPPLTLDDEDEMGQDDGSTAVDEDNSADESPTDEIIPSPTPDGDSGIPSDDPTPAE